MLALVGLPVVLWALSTCYWGGDLGKYMDVWNNSVRDPETGHYTFAEIFGKRHTRGPFYRPGTTNLRIVKGTLLWNHDRADHLFCAVTHGLVVLVFWLLMRRLVASPTIAALGAMVYMTFPLHYQLMHYSMGQPYHFAVLSCLLLLLVLIRFARGQWGWWSVGLMALLTYGITLWQEQPATVVPLLPLLYLAVCSPRERWSRRAWRAGAAVFVCGLACVLYVVLIAVSVPGRYRGSAEAYAGPSDLPERLETVIRTVQRGLGGRAFQQLTFGSLDFGLQTLLDHRGWAIWALLLLLTGVAWYVQFLRRPEPAAEDTPARPPARRAATILFGLGLFALGWVPPMMVKAQGMEIRFHYYPLIGLVLASVVLLDWIDSGLRSRRTLAVGFRALVAAVLLVAAVVGSICHVGYQTLFRKRYMQDMSEVAQLKELVPQPDPNAVFVPLAMEDDPAHTRWKLFNKSVISAFATSWSARSIVRYGYRRRDITCTHLSPWIRVPLSYPDRTSVAYHSRSRKRAAQIRFEWERLVPFVVDRAARVHLVTRFDVQSFAEGLFDVVVPQTERAAARQGLPRRSFALVDTDPPEDAEILTGWRWAKDDQPVEFRPVRQWGLRLPAASMHTPYRGYIHRGAWVTDLRSSSRACRLIFFVTLAEARLRAGRMGDGADLIWRLEGEDGALATVFLDPKKNLQRERWRHVAVSLPPLPNGGRLIVEVCAGPGGTASNDLCLVTQGHRLDIQQSGAADAAEPARSR